ncbi:MAG: hypothetical protein KF712_15935 [Akkermansiaceae bacterium]|nr:hypothetical protein [Akkermansiaceae bacterium]
MPRGSDGGASRYIAGFYRKLDATLEKIGFTQGVRDLCRPAYADASKDGPLICCC